MARQQESHHEVEDCQRHDLSLGGSSAVIEEVIRRDSPFRAELSHSQNEERTDTADIGLSINQTRGVTVSEIRPVMTRRQLLQGLVALGVAPLAAACASASPSPAPTKPASTSVPASATSAPAAPAVNKGAKIILKAASNQTGNENSVNWGWTRLGEELQKRMPGAIDYQFFPAGQLGGDNTFVQGMQLGTIQMAVVGAISSVAPRLGVLDILYLFTSDAHAQRYLNSSNYADLESELPSKGIQPFPQDWWWSSWRQLSNNKRPVKTPDDVKGLKLRTPPIQAYIQGWEALGANPTAMDFNEVYTALQTNVIDGQENPAEIILSNKLYEVQKYLSLTRHLFWAPPPLASKKWWDSLPKDIQSGVEDAMHAVAPLQRKFSMDHDAEYTKQLGQNGMQVNEVDMQAFISVARDKIWPQYEKDFGKDIQVIDSMRQ